MIVARCVVRCVGGQEEKRHLRAEYEGDNALAAALDDPKVGPHEDEGPHAGRKVLHFLSARAEAGAAALYLLPKAFI